MTRTKWWVVPMFWGPITIFLFALSALQFTDKYGACYAVSGCR